MTNTQPQAGNTIPTSHPAWAHIDQICPDDGDLLTQVAESVEAVQADLLSGKAIDARLMAEVLGCALGDIRKAGDHLDDAVVVMSGQQLND